MSFSIDLSRAIERAKGKQALVIKKVMLEAFSKVVMKSPVKSGRFRANWQTKLGGYGRVSIKVLDKDGTATVARINSAVMSLPLNGQRIYLYNALPYATRLEHGWSHRQAPQGMVKITLAEITAKYGT